MLIIGLTGSIATGKSTVSAILSSPPHNIPVIDADVLAREAVEPGTRAYRRIVEYFEPIVAAESESDSESKPSSSSSLESAGSTEAEATDKASKNSSNGSGDDLFLPSPSESSSSTPSSPQTHSNSHSRPLNRATLSRLVFGSTPTHVRHRRRLNSIVHPAVRRAMVAALLRCYLSGCWAVVLDVPLLFESGWDVLSGTVVVVAVWDKAVQMRRLRERDREKRDGNTNTNNLDNGIDVKKDGEKEEAEVKGRISSQGGMLDKVARAMVREGLDSDIDALVGDEKKKKRGIFGRGRGVVLWNDDDTDEEEDGDDDAENDYINVDGSDDDNDSNKDADDASKQIQKILNSNKKQKKQNQIDRLRKDVDAIVRQLERQSPRWWAWTLLACPPLAILVAAYSCARSYWARRKWEQGGKGTNERLRRTLEEMERDMLDRAKL